MVFNSDQLGALLDWAQGQGNWQMHLLLKNGELAIWSEANKRAFLDFWEADYVTLLSFSPSKTYSQQFTDEEKQQINRRLQTLGHEFQWFEKGSHD